MSNKKANRTSKSTNNNPFAIEDSQRVTMRDAFFPQGTYTFRVIHMECWTHHKDGSRHDIPALGLILGSVDRSDRRQVKITLMCPRENKDNVIYFIQKVNAVLDALGMGVDDFYNAKAQCAGDALRDRSHPANPVGKQITLHVQPIEYPVCDRDGFKVTRKRFEKESKRALFPNERFAFDEAEDGVTCEVLVRKDGNYRLVEVMK